MNTEWNPRLPWRCVLYYDDGWFKLYQDKHFHKLLHKYVDISAIRAPAPMWQTSSLTLSCRSSNRSLMMSCRSSAGMRSEGQAVSSVSTRLLQDRSACRFALKLRRTRLRSTTCCRMEFTSWRNTPEDKWSWAKFLSFSFYLWKLCDISKGNPEITAHVKRIILNE